MWSDKTMLAEVEKIEAETPREAGEPYRFGKAREKYKERKTTEGLARQALMEKHKLLELVEDGTVAKAVVERLPVVAEMYQKQKFAKPANKAERISNLENDLFAVLARGVCAYIKDGGLTNMIEVEAVLAHAMGRLVAELLAMTADHAVDLEGLDKIVGDKSDEEATRVLREAVEIACHPMHKTGCSMFKAAHEKFHEFLDQVPERVRASSGEDRQEYEVVLDG